MIALLLPLIVVAQLTHPVDLRVTAITGGARLRLAVQDPRTHSTVRTFAVVHERPMHLFIVSDTLAFFAHEYPVPQPDGVFMLDVTLPAAGAYMAIAEFLPEGGTPQTFQQMFTTGSAFAAPAPPALDPGPHVMDGVSVSLDASQAKAGEARPLVVRIADATTGAAAAVEPYLGAAAHLLLVSADLTEVVHAQPSGPPADAAIGFTPLVPRPGRYKAWVQFQRAGRVSTASFVLDVR